jgi:NAD(P)H-hydrate epimerase
MKLTTAEQMKELDRQAIEERGIPSIDLMERAAGNVGGRPCAARATTAAMESPQPGCCF